MAKCRVCGAPAVACVRYQRKYLCRKHYVEFIESKVEKAIKRYGMISPGFRVLAAVSGGKDSSTLLGVLSRLRHSLGFELVSLYIHLGIFDYSEKSKKAALSLSEVLGIPTIVLDLKEVIGMGIPELAKASRRPPCSVCGMVKRYVINAAAVELGADAVALGHNADDITVYNVKSFISQDLEAISKLGAKTDSISGLAVGRIRPLYNVYEKESFLYSLLRGLPFLHEECPFVERRQMEIELKEMINKLEERSPGIKLQMVSKLALRIKDYPRPSGSIGRCPSCGLISSGGECSFCRTTRRAVGRPMGSIVRKWIRSKAMELGFKSSR